MSQPLRCYHAYQRAPIKNLGDALTPVVLAALGYRCVSRESRQPVVNGDRCLFAAGSLLDDRFLGLVEGTVDVWGSGATGTQIAPDHRARLRIHAVRGPLTAAALDLGGEVPLGDPALLLRDLRPPRRPAHGRTLVMPHFERAWSLSARRRRLQTGCEGVLSARVRARPSLSRRHLRSLAGVARARLALGIATTSVDTAIERIAGCGFLLTGSLHGAILAQAYGVPWAAFDDGFVSMPFKWHDWGRYLGVRVGFVSTLAEGWDWWRSQGRRGRLRDLEPLVGALPEATGRSA